MKLEKRDSPTMISLHFYHVSRWWFRCHSSFRPLPGANVTSHSISRCKTQPFSSRLYKTVPKMVREKRFVAFLCLCKSTQSIPHIWKTVFSHLEPSHQSHCSHFQLYYPRFSLYEGNGLGEQAYASIRIQ